MPVPVVPSPKFQEKEYRLVPPDAVALNVIGLPAVADGNEKSAVSVATALEGYIAETPKMSNATMTRATSTEGTAGFVTGTDRAVIISGLPTFSGL